MSRNLHRTLVACLFCLVFAGLAVPTDATAQGGGGEARAKGEKESGSVIDITGLMARPRGDTRIPWTRPEGFSRDLQIDFGKVLRDEVLSPVDRPTLRRRMEVERSLNW